MVKLSQLEACKWESGQKLVSQHSLASTLFAVHATVATLSWYLAFILSKTLT